LSLLLFDVSEGKGKGGEGQEEVEEKGTKKEEMGKRKRKGRKGQLSSPSKNSGYTALRQSDRTL